MTASRPIVGLTLNYRDAVRTLRCVQSLLMENVEHVIIWDNSEDGGKSVDSLKSNLKQESRVEIVSSTTNLGFAAAVNRGISLIKERYARALVLLINNDARLLPGAAATLAVALDCQPQAAIAYPDIDHAGTILGTIYYQRYTGLLTHRRLPGSFAYASGCCLLIDMDRVEPPLFDEDFFMYGEDWLLGWKLREQEKMLHVPETLVFHEGSASSGLGSEFYETRMVAAHWLSVGKLAENRWDYLLLMVGRLLMLSIRGGVRVIRYRSIIPLRALLQGWHMAKNKCQ